jgi:chromosome segregation ATPase
LFARLQGRQRRGGESVVTKSFKDWLNEGENLYNSTLAEFQQLENQLTELEQRLAAKKAEVNQIAQVIGKPPVESSRRLAAELVDTGQGQSVPNSPATIARALTGRGLGR